MEWSRIKTIILIILAVTNVSLLGFLVQRELQVQNARQEARQNSIQFLENNGVTVEDETVPEEMTLLPQTVEWDREQEREAAAVLLGGEVQEQAWSDEIYRYYNETGSIQFHRDGTFQGEFVEGAFQLEGQDAAAYAFQLEGQDAAAYSLQVLEILGIQGESLSVQADSGEEDAVTVVCRQLWNQVPVFNHLITLTFREDSLSAVEGRRLTGEPALDTGQKPISIPTALFQFYHGMVALGDVCSRIESITPGYVTSAGTGPSALTPVWYIATDTRNYRLDTLTGELSRAEESGA